MAGSKEEDKALIVHRNVGVTRLEWHLTPDTVDALKEVEREHTKQALEATKQAIATHEVPAKEKTKRERFRTLKHYRAVIAAIVISAISVFTIHDPKTLAAVFVVSLTTAAVDSVANRKKKDEEE